ncbi:MAG: hypothetical protein NTNFB01_20960 [Nitrospira sp.]
MGRGHEVTAIVRHPNTLPPHPHLHPLKADIYQADEVARSVGGHGAVTSAFNPSWSNPYIYNRQVKGAKAIIGGSRLALWSIFCWRGMNLRLRRATTSLKRSAS